MTQDITELVRGAREGVAESWDALLQRYQLPLYSYVHQLVHQEQTSLDIVQETFISAVRYLHNLQDDRKFGSWIFSIAHQKCIQLWRSQKNDALPLESEFAEVSSDNDDPSEWLLRKEQEEQFLRALEGLPETQRAVILLHFIEEFSLEEIARITNVQIGTVKSRIHYAKKALRQILDQSGADASSYFESN
jgi:RNA polymerase sigma-70 factor (ECF subfamily)